MEILPSGAYRISNAQQSGALFTSAARFARINHEVGLSSEDREFGCGEPASCAGKWRWEVEQQADGSYRIASGHVGGALFASVKALNRTGDRKVGVSTVDREEEEGCTGKWRWWIERQEDGSYTVSNKQRGGVLVCNSCQFRRCRGNFQVGWSPAGEARENSGKWRWHFHPTPPQIFTCLRRSAAACFTDVAFVAALSGHELATVQVESVANISLLRSGLSERLMVPVSELRLLDLQGRLLSDSDAVSELPQ